MIFSIFLVTSLLLMSGPEDVLVWNFDGQDTLPPWVANSHLSNVQMKDGILSMDAIDTDPILTVSNLEFSATPWQFVLVRIKADISGTLEVFWTGSYDPPYGGFRSDQRVPVQFSGGNEWKTVAFFPGWHTEGTIRQLRLDVYAGGHFEVDWIKVIDWGKGISPVQNQYTWDLPAIQQAWKIHPEVPNYYAPPLNLQILDHNYVTMVVTSPLDGMGSFYWSINSRFGVHTEDFVILGDGKPHPYNIDLGGNPKWQGNVVLLGVKLPRTIDGKEGASLHSISLATQPSGPPFFEAQYFGFEEGIRRVGKECGLLLHGINRGGSEIRSASIELVIPEGVELTEGGPIKELPLLRYEEPTYQTWKIQSQSKGPHQIKLKCYGPGMPAELSVDLLFDEPMDLPVATSVPDPQPVTPEIDVAMYYFPGWDSNAKWDPVRWIAPIRKPILGYYDEANPECVDWQIKWAVENSINVFLLDWYWIQGYRFLEHWLEAYKNSKHRDHLKVALMWANHNPDGTHSAEDWQQVTQYWIDHVFPLPSYYRINGKPAVFIWSPRLIHSDLGGTDAVKDMLAASQQQAQQAGYSGIEYLAMFDYDSPSLVSERLEEGYTGATSYHEWGDAVGMAPSPKLVEYADVVDTASAAWKRHNSRCGNLTYLPVVDTGWDARPWHGNSAMVIRGRTPALFENLLIQARSFCQQHNKKIVVLGPANEWGEGSYIEPNTEYGFEMYERVRKIFGTGDPSTWPANYGPTDVGLGPYDFPPTPLITHWTFDSGLENWRSMMGTSPLSVQSGKLVFTTTSKDPALIVDTPGLIADNFSHIRIRMKVTGLPIFGQVFWSRLGTNMSESASRIFYITRDEQMHDYFIQLSENSRWRGLISSIRFDPCDVQDVEVTIDEMELIPKEKTVDNSNFPFYSKSIE